LHSAAECILFGIWVVDPGTLARLPQTSSSGSGLGVAVPNGTPSELLVGGKMTFDVRISDGQIVFSHVPIQDSAKSSCERFRLEVLKQGPVVLLSEHVAFDQVLCTFRFLCRHLFPPKE